MAHEHWLGVEKLPRFEDPMTALLWGSRIYLAHAISGEPTPPVLNLLFKNVLSIDTRPALFDSLDFLIFHSTMPFILHPLNCLEVSVHERALADGIRAIQSGSLQEYCRAMERVLTASDALVVGPKIQTLANALARIEAQGFVQSANIIAPTQFRQAAEAST
ncbi:MAG: hypothetical protein AAFN07_13640 [Pseudomonadota bacterium]